MKRRRVMRIKAGQKKKRKQLSEEQREKNNLYYKLWREKNKEHYLAYKNSAEVKARNKALRQSPESKKRRAAYYKKTKEKQKVQRRARYLKNRVQTLAIAEIWRNKHFFNGLRLKAMERDGYKCVHCGISQGEHLKKWKISLHIHHRDGFGTVVPKEQMNNSLSNLETVCISCHATEEWKLRRMRKNEIGGIRHESI